MYNIYSKFFFPILNNKNPCPLIIRILVIMYRNMEVQVNRNNIKSCKFRINNGVKQGDVISPLLFIIYTNILINKLILYKTCCRVENISTCMLMMLFSWHQWELVCNDFWIFVRIMVGNIFGAGFSKS